MTSTVPDYIAKLRATKVGNMFALFDYTATVVGLLFLFRITRLVALWRAPFLALIVGFLAHVLLVSREDWTAATKLIYILDFTSPVVVVTLVTAFIGVLPVDVALKGLK